MSNSKPYRHPKGAPNGQGGRFAPKPTAKETTTDKLALSPSKPTTHYQKEGWGYGYTLNIKKSNGKWSDASPDMVTGSSLGVKLASDWEQTQIRYSMALSQVMAHHLNSGVLPEDELSMVGLAVLNIAGLVHDPQANEDTRVLNQNHYFMAGDIFLTMAEQHDKRTRNILTDELTEYLLGVEDDMAYLHGFNHLTEELLEHIFSYSRTAKRPLDNDTTINEWAYATLKKMTELNFKIEPSLLSGDLIAHAARGVWQTTKDDPTLDFIEWCREYLSDTSRLHDLLEALRSRSRMPDTADVAHMWGALYINATNFHETPIFHTKNFNEAIEYKGRSRKDRKNDPKEFVERIVYALGKEHPASQAALTLTAQPVTKGW